MNMYLKRKSLWVIGLVGAGIVATLIWVIMMLVTVGVNVGLNGSMSVSGWYVVVAFSLIGLSLIFTFVSYAMLPGATTSCNKARAFASASLALRIIGWIVLSIVWTNSFLEFLLFMILGLPILSAIGGSLLARGYLTASRVLAIICAVIDMIQPLIITIIFSNITYGRYYITYNGTPATTLLLLLLIPLISPGFNLLFVNLGFKKRDPAAVTAPGRDALSPRRTDNPAGFAALRPTYTAMRPAPGTRPSDYVMPADAGRSDTRPRTAPYMTPAGIPNRRVVTAPAPVQTAPDRLPDAPAVSLVKEAEAPKVSLAKEPDTPAAGPDREAQSVADAPDDAYTPPGEECDSPAAPYVPDTVTLDLDDHAPKTYEPAPEMDDPNAPVEKDYGSSPSLDTASAGLPEPKIFSVEEILGAAPVSPDPDDEMDDFGADR